MRKKLIPFTLASVFLLALLAGCGGGGPPFEPYPGANDTPYSLGDNFTINITDDTETRFKYAVCAVTIEIGDPAMIPTFDANRHRLRENVIFTVGSRTVSQLGTEEQKAEVLAEIVSRINAEFNTDTVHRAVFSNFYFHT